MIWEKFKDQFHESWHKKMQPFIESEECDKIYKFLKKESGRGKTIVPLSSNVFRCFKETSYDDLKVVIMGFSPYHTMRNGIIVADGLLMSCSETGYLQPSLAQFYQAVETELYNGLKLDIDKNPDLKYLAKQGVLLFNASLTTELNKAGSHLELWEPFIKYVFDHVINTSMVPVVFLGKEAIKYEKYTAPFSWIFKVSHPASAAYNNSDWDSEGVFKGINKILKDTNNETIKWLTINK